MPFLWVKTLLFAVYVDCVWCSSMPPDCLHLKEKLRCFFLHFEKFNVILTSWSFAICVKLILPVPSISSSQRNFLLVENFQTYRDVGQREQKQHQLL